MPVSLLEACAAQVPVIVTRSSNKAGLIRNGENGLEVGNDLDALAGGLRDILNDLQKYKKMALASSELVKKEFSLAIMAKQYEAVYLKILADKGISPH